VTAEGVGAGGSGPWAAEAGGRGRRVGMVRQAAGTCVKRRDGEMGDGSWARVAVGTGQGGALGQRNNAVVGARWVPSTPSWGRSGARKGEVGRRKKREVRSERPGCGAGAALRCGGCGSLTSRWGRLGFVGRRGRLGKATWCVDGGLDASALFGRFVPSAAPGVPRWGAGCGGWGGGEQRLF
jgi:hypothetical protein